MDSLPTSPEVTYNWVNITGDFFKNIQGMLLIQLLLKLLLNLLFRNQLVQELGWLI